MNNDNREVRDLLRLKEEIEQAKAEKNRVEGELRQLQTSMKEEFGNDDPKEVQVKITALRRQAAQIREQINDGMSALKKELGE